LTRIDDLLETASRSGEPVTRATVLAEVNLVIQAELGDIIRVSISRPRARRDRRQRGDEGDPEIGFARCENRDTAVSAVLVRDPNGGGKTFQMEAFARPRGASSSSSPASAACGTGARTSSSSAFCGSSTRSARCCCWSTRRTPRFGSVHKSDTHETERRLAGNFIKMVGDPKLRGKLLLALMTSRPDELDPDLKSRSPLQVPIFDPEGDERKKFVGELFARRKITLSPEELDSLLSRTAHYSARDFDNLVRGGQGAGQARTRRPAGLAGEHVDLPSAAPADADRLPALLISAAPAGGAAHGGSRGGVARDRGAQARSTALKGRGRWRSCLLHIPVECVCGAVEYRVTAEPLTLYACHCTDCQALSSSAFRISMPVLRDAGGDPSRRSRTVRVFADRRVDEARPTLRACSTWLWGEPERLPRSS
jgi:hypothetical protein